MKKIKLTLLIALSIIIFFIAFFTITPNVKADIDVSSSSVTSLTMEVIENNISNSNNNTTSSVESQVNNVTENINDNILISTPTEDEIETEKQYLEEFKGEFKFTAYCPCYKCSEGYGYNTATGVKAKANRTIAVDPKVIPYGTKVIIEINGERKMYVAEDCGGAIKKKRIDIFFETHSETTKFGVRKGKVYILTENKE